MNVSTPPSTGFTNRWDNVATILNRGVELAVKSRNLIGEFQWTTELNFARNYNELAKHWQLHPGCGEWRHQRQPGDSPAARWAVSTS